MNRLLATLLLSAAMLGAAAAGPAPGDVVASMTGQFLAQAARPGAGADLPRLRALVESTVMPNIDFRSMTSRAVGPRWRTATSEQQAHLMAHFETLLIKTYAGALAQTAGATFKLKGTLAVDPSTAQVRSEVRIPDAADPIEIDYRLALEDGRWKITDVSVAGIWLVEIYQSQFAQVMDQSGVDGLVLALANKARAS